MSYAMLTNEQIVSRIQKAQIDGSLGGTLSPEDVRQFVMLAAKQAQILQEIRNERNIITSRNIKPINMGENAMVADDTVGEAPNDNDITAPEIGNLELNPKKVRAFYDLEFDFIRQNIEGDNVNTTINNLFAMQWGEDSVDLIFNGDTTAGTATKRARLLRRLDGFVKKIKNDGNAHEYAINSQDYLGTVFPALLSMLPPKWKRRRRLLRLFVSPNVMEAYEKQIIQRNTALGDQTLIGSSENPRFYNRIKLVEVEAIPDNNPIMTIGNNLVIGFGQEMRQGVDISNREELVKYTIRGHIDAGYLFSQAIVMGN